MKNMKIREAIKEWGAITIATLIISLSVFFFVMPGHLTIGSITGLAIVMSEFIPLQVSTLTLVLNLVLLVLGVALIGKSFGVKTVYVSILMPVFIGILERMFPEGGNITNNIVIDMICHCFFVSIGLAMLFNRNASSGGLDIVAKILNRYLRMEMGQAMSAAGMCVAISAALVYDVNTVLLSVVGTYINGIVLDHMIFGATVKKRVCILSQKEPEIRDYILNTLHSGATIYNAYGAYTDNHYKELVVVVDKAEYLKLMNFLSTADPDAFVTVYAANEVLYKPKSKLEH